MVTNYEVARAFSNGETKPHTKYMFIDDDTIYSYGYHFPMARKIKDGVYLINSNSYSSSTSKHMGHVKTSLMWSKQIYLKGCDLKNIELQILSNNEQIDILNDLLTRVRVAHMKQRYTSEIKELKQQNENLSELKE